MERLPAFAFVLIQLWLAASCTGSKSTYYKATAIEVMSVTVNGEAMTVAVNAVAETNYYCGSVKVKEGNDAITLYFERNKIGSGSGYSQREIKISNPRKKSLQIGDQGGGNVEIWRKP